MIRKIDTGSDAAFYVASGDFVGLEVRFEPIGRAIPRVVLNVDRETAFLLGNVLITMSALDLEDETTVDELMSRVTVIE